MIVEWAKSYQSIQMYWAILVNYVYYVSVNTGLANGLVPDGSKPLPDAMLTYHQ